MRHKILLCTIAMLPVLLTSCNSSKSTDGGVDSHSEIDVSKIGEPKGIANGKITIGGKTYPIEFTADAYPSKDLSLDGSTDLVYQYTGWSINMTFIMSATFPQVVDAGRNQTQFSYHAKRDTTTCGYNAKTGTITIESFSAKKSGTDNYFTTSGKAGFTATAYGHSPTICPAISVELTFSNAEVFDHGYPQ